ncbi:hypothetical protein F5Y06DRAFT_140941 [Hypoxylon sp. FL0890]|nr:hypothetical protein F5Y06DRAFT_140941 [Hypoxylon sp. FL0890]
MARTDGRVGLAPFLVVSNLLVWISAVIVMGIVSYFISLNDRYVSGHIIYEEVISVLTVAFLLLSFILGSYPGYSLLFNIVFSYLWLVSVVFTAEDWSSDYAGALDHTVEAFSFIAFFFLFFNVLYDWHFGFRGHVRTNAAV